MIKELQEQANFTYTKNGAIAYASTLSCCLDLFAVIGAQRGNDEEVVLKIFHRAFCENPDFAFRIAFYARDIRQGLGERRIFRIIVAYVSRIRPEAIIKNIHLFAEYGRFDDLLTLIGTPCETAMGRYIKKQLAADILSMEEKEKVSLMAKWLPSVNTSSVKACNSAKKICSLIGMRHNEYRKTLSALRSYLDVLEKRLCAKDYSFEYEKQPSKALYKYRCAFYKNDCKKYMEFIEAVRSGRTNLKTGSLYPYEIVRDAINEVENPSYYAREREILNTTWNALGNYTDNRNALAVVDGSGSMYNKNNPRAIEIAISLGIYFAERNTGKFTNHFITFSQNPRLIEIKGSNIVDKVKYCMDYNEIANTDLYKVFMLVLSTAVKNNLPQSELPDMLYIISDMEFDCGTVRNMTLFEDAKAKYSEFGYKLPILVYWNVEARNEQFPVKQNDEGVVLVSGASPTVFRMVMQNDITPMCLMLDVVQAKRYSSIHA